MEHPEYHDVLILGAGLSGINTAYTLRQSMPHRQFSILEARDTLGGTWALFKYPHFRSDSNLTNFGFSWHPWPHAHRIGTGAEIIDYLEDAADKHGIKEHIRFRHRVVDVSWSSTEQQWTVDVEVGGEGGTRKVLKANWMMGCTGYYSYSRAFPVEIPGLADFKGRVVHPQWWPEDLDYAGKRIVVIGSGATAVTLIPALAETAASVTMLQRTPSYVFSIPMYSKLRNFLAYFLPVWWAQAVCWYRDIFLEVVFTRAITIFPNFARWLLTTQAKKALPDHVDVGKHFNPPYNPGQQRVCLCPDGNFFKALHQENCEVVTDHIESVQKDGILLKSGRRLEADIIITATGLYFELLGGIHPSVDGQRIVPGDHFAWRGCMLESVPNLGFIMGYTVSTYTPGANLMARMLFKVMRNMERKGAAVVMPAIKRTKDMPTKIAVDATSSYFLKAADRIPKVTGKGPWYGRTHVIKDLWALWFGSVEDGLVYRGIKDKSI